MRSCDLEGKLVRHEGGETFGRVFEIQIKDGHVDVIICGPGGLWQRLIPAHAGRRIPWNRVRTVGREILIGGD